MQINLILGIIIITVSLFVGILIGYGFQLHRTRLEIGKLIHTLDTITRGKKSNNLSMFREGEFGLLAHQLQIAMSHSEGMAEKLTQEKAEIKDYIADISHELKTPMTALIAYLDLISIYETNPEKKEKLDSCLMLSEKMNELIKGLLNLARLENDELEMKISKHSLKETVGAAHQMLLQCDLTTNLVIKNELEPELTGRYNDLWMRQAIFNIMKNAALYAGESPIIKISATTTEIGVTIHISDNGPGLSEYETAHIFDRFYRADKQKAGSGIGLTVSNLIVKKHHGKLSVSSDSQETVFSIFLPVLNSYTSEKV